MNFIPALGIRFRWTVPFEELLLSNCKQANSRLFAQFFYSVENLYSSPRITFKHFYTTLKMGSFYRQNTIYLAKQAI
jgi:hypothetical protein